MALTLGSTFCHVMEMPGDGATWLAVRQNLAFGVVGAAIELWTVAAGLCVTAGLAAWFAWRRR